MSGLFAGRKFVLVVGDTSTEARRLRREIQDSGGVIAYSIGPQVSTVVASPDEVSKRGSKISSAIRKRIPVVSAAYVDDCITQQTVLDTAPYTIAFSDSVENDFVDNDYDGAGLGASSELFPEDTTPAEAGDSIQPTTFLLREDNVREQIKEIRVFVSSTFKDMSIEREQLIKYVFPELKNLCDEHGIFFSYVDLRWGITEEEGQDGQTLNLCLSEIDRCRPYFLCMLGERYGWHQPSSSSDALLTKTFQTAADKFPWILNFPDRSITELEIRHAILNAVHGGDMATSSKMHCLFYMRDPRAAFLNQLPDGIGITRSESPEASSKLTSLKSEIRSAKLMCKEYKSEAQFAHIVLDDLRRAISTDIRRARVGYHSTAAPSSAGTFEQVQQDYSPHIAYAKHRTLGYVANDATLRRLTTFAFANTSNECPFILYGESGSGKSALLANWFVQQQGNIEDKNRAFFSMSDDERRKEIRTDFPPLVVAHFIGSSPQAAEHCNIMRRIMAAVRVHFSLAMSMPDRDEDIIREFPHWLQAAADRGRVVVLIDSLDLLSGDRQEISRSSSNAFLTVNDSSSREEVRISSLSDTVPSGSGDAAARSLNWLPLSFPPEVRFIISCSPGPLLQHLFTARSWNKQSLPMPGLTDEEKKLLISGYLALFAKKLSSIDQLALVSSQLSSSPLFLRAVLDELRSNASFDSLGAQIRLYSSSPSISELYDRILTRWERDYNGPDPEKPVVKLALSYLFASRRGLSESELISLLQPPNRSVWTKFYLSVQESLFNHGGLLNFFHKYFADAVRKRYVKDPETSQMLHRALALYFEADSVPTARKVDELPFHYELSGNRHQLREFLRNQQFFPQLYTEQNKSDLFHYWHYVGDSNETIAEGYVTALRRFEGTNPPNDVLAASVRATAKFLEEIGEYQNSNRIFHQALHGDSILFGQWHEVTATDLFYLAVTYFHLADYDASANYARQALDMRIHVMGPQHLDTAECLSLLALIYKKEANYERARDLYSEAITIARAALGPSHGKLAHFLLNLGDVHRKLAEFDAAQACYQNALEISKILFGEHSIQVADIENSIGLVFKKKGDYSNSEQAYKEAITLVAGHYGADHPKYAILAYNLADVYRKKDEFAKAEELYRLALTITKKTYGEQHPEVAEIYNDMGLLKKKEGLYDEATYYHSQALKIIESTLGPMHPKAGMYLSNLADVERKQGHFDAAEELYKKALAIVEKSYGMNHIEVAEVLNSMGLVLKKRMMYDQAQPLYERALNIVQRQLGISHPKVGIYLNNLADLHRKRFNYHSALSLYRRALGIIKQTLGKNHSEAADIYNNMAMVYSQLGDPRKAIKLLQKALLIVRNEFGDVHPKIGMYSANLADAFLMCSEEATAISLYQQSLDMLEKTLGGEHVEVADVLVKMAANHQSRGQYRDAFDKYSRAKEIVRKALGVSHPKVALCDRALEELTTRDPTLASAS